MVPAWRRRSLTSSLVKLGYEESLRDICARILRGVTCLGGMGRHERQRLQNLPSPFVDSGWLVELAETSADGACESVIGLILIGVDDLFADGNEVHCVKMELLRTECKMGRWSSRSTEGGGVFGGRRIEQLKDSISSLPCMNTRRASSGPSTCQSR